ncbi:hypothetical protein [Rubritalea tangerina]|uniref:hypothetical protein n=1 Tax=Rubritalea tangerina TaxID=430798 RepID=UPI00361288CB
MKVNAKEFTDLLKAAPSSQILLNLEVEGSDSHKVFLQDLQFDALTGYSSR